MADPFSLVGRTPPPGPMARPSFFDQVLGRGSYMKEFSARRREIMQKARQEKRRVSVDYRRQRRKYELKLRSDDKKIYQQFDIKLSQRANKPGLDEQAQVKVRAKAWKEITKQMRRQNRATERAIERNREAQIRAMRDSLRDKLNQPTDGLEAIKWQE